MGFKFRYETLLSYRQHLKEKAVIDFAQAQQQLRDCRNGLEALNHKRFAMMSLMESDLKEKLSSNELKNYSHFMNALEDQIISHEEEIARWEKIVQEKMAILLEKSKQHKVIEKLKEKDLAKWTRHQNLLEQKAMNETAIIRYGKRPA
ncbi:MAG: flagellar export protein FliJ [Deltaproteobacteria bacterium]|nr:flagellar export protein FliJ [Deltaproteobacteria bacterium]